MSLPESQCKCQSAASFVLDADPIHLDMSPAFWALTVRQQWNTQACIPQHTYEKETDAKEK